MKRICGNCWYWNPAQPDREECKDCGKNRKKFYPRELNCPVCETSMIMYEYKYAMCPDCGTRTDPFFKEITEEDTIREEFEKKLPAMRGSAKSKAFIHTKNGNGGSKSSRGRSKQEAHSKKTPNQMHNILAAQPNKIIHRKLDEKA